MHNHRPYRFTALLVVVLSACTAGIANDLVAPRMTSAYVGVDRAISSIGCVVVARDEAGGLATTLLPRSEVQSLVGHIDSVSTRIINGRRVARALHVLSATVHAAGQHNAYRVSCLEPHEVTEAQFAKLLITSVNNPIWREASTTLRPYTGPTTRSDVSLASQILLSSLTRNSQQKTMRVGDLPSRSTGIVAPSSIRREVFDCHKEMNTSCNTASLPVITVTADPNTNSLIIVDMSELYFFMQEFPLIDMNGIVLSYPGVPTCQNYSDMYWALDEELSRLENAAAQIEAATQLVAALTCQSDLTEGGYNYCIDLFIKSEQAAFYVGDDRSFDPNAPYKASRAQIYINPATCEVRYVVNTSRILIQGPFYDSVQAPHKLNKVNAERLGDGSCRVTWRLLNGYCGSVGGQPMCPAIDGQITFSPSPNGIYGAQLVEDKFPSRGLYRWDPNSGFQTIDEREGTIFLDLISLRKQITNIQERQQQVLRDSGCELQ